MTKSFANHTRRSLLQAAAAGAIVSSTGLGAYAQGSTKLTPVKVAGSVPVYGQAPAFLMKLMKFDAKHGLDVDLIQMGGNSSLMVDAVVSGSALFATPGTLTVLQAIRSGAEIVILGAYATNHIASVISKTAMAKTGLTATSPAADKIRAMKGMTIGTNPVGSTFAQVFGGYLKKYGLNPETDVRLVYVADTMALVSGIDQGRFDAIVSATSIVEQAVTLGSANLWFSGSTGEFFGAENEVMTVAITRRDTVEKNPELVKAYTAALQDGLDLMNNDREKTADRLYKEYFNKMDPAVWKMVLDGTKLGFPKNAKFTKEMLDSWIKIDPKGPDSYKDVDYKKIVYAPHQG